MGRQDTRPVREADPGINAVLSRGQGPAKLWTAYDAVFSESCHDVIMVPEHFAPSQSLQSFFWVPIPEGESNC